MAYYEIKYLVPMHTVSPLRSWLESAYGNSDPYASGIVDSLYFDTPQSNLYAECAQGAYVKTKVRLRSYDGLSFSTAQVKKKTGLQVTKLVHPIGLSIGATLAPDLLKGLGNSPEFPLPFPLVPRLRVIYQRHRYRTGTLRFTLDHEIHFASQSLGLPYIRASAYIPFAVLEIKCGDMRGTFREIRHWNLQLVSFSKFFVGECLLRVRSDALARYW